MPEAFISTTTSSGPGVGSGNSISSISRSPVKTTPRIGSSAFRHESKEQAYAVSGGGATASAARKSLRMHPRGPARGESCLACSEPAALAHRLDPQEGQAKPAAARPHLANLAPVRRHDCSRRGGGPLDLYRHQPLF